MSTAQITSEIKQYLLSNNIENATKRLLDFAWYYSRESQQYASSIALRKKYNLSKSLGQQELEATERTHFKSKINEILSQLEKVVDPNSEQNTEHLIQIRNLTKTFLHRAKAFSFGPLDMDIDKGNIVGVVGENGNGKTTFLRLLQEEITRDTGQITYNYNLADIAAEDQYKRKNRTAFIPQRIPKWRGTLMENLTFFAAIHGFKGAKNDEIVEYVIHRMGLSAFTGLTWNQISTGYKLRFELAKMLVWEPDILILDEPLANLDIQATQYLLDDLRFFANSSIHPIGVLLTSQQLHEVEQIADKILFLKNGKPIFSGLKSEFEETREEGIIEFSLAKHPDDLGRLLLNIKGVNSVNLSAKVNNIKFDKTHSSSDMIRTLLDSGLELTYFRDITNSTIQLFSD
ncbi:MAG: ABC transporter ATP-binding protein [Crocinitomicaceae bacterium]|nr:ABC transporter ATP-binding protein [Crocinitomicaceae bacterium]